MKYSEDYVNDFDGFVKVLKEAIKEANYCDFTDEQMRNVWASNFNRWKEKEGHTDNEETAVVVEAPAEEKPKMSPNDYLRKVDLLEYKLVGEVDKGLTIPKIQEVIECVDNLTTEIEGLGVDMDSDEWVEVTLGLERLEEIKRQLEAVFDGLSELRGVRFPPPVQRIP